VNSHQSKTTADLPSQNFLPNFWLPASKASTVNRYCAHQSTPDPLLSYIAIVAVVTASSFVAV